MADIEILNGSGALNNCSEMSTYSSQMDDCISSLNSDLQKINSNWSSNGIDKESYMVELNKQITKLQVIRDQLNKFSNAISNYVTNNSQVSSLRIGDSFSGYSGTGGYTSASNAVSGTNNVALNSNYVNGDSTVNALAVVDNGKVTKVTYADGMTVEQFAQDNGVTVDKVAASVAKDGVSQAWVSASDFN